MKTSRKNKTIRKGVFLFLALIALLTISVAVVTAAPSPAAEAGVEIPDQYIITYKEGVITTAATRAGTRNLVTMFGGQVFSEYQYAINGFSARLTPAALAVLQSNPIIASIEQDMRISLDPREKWKRDSILSTDVTSFSMDFSTSSVQNVGAFNSNLWGLDRIDQVDLPLNNTYGYDNTASDVHVYVIDTGILPTHVEFGGRASMDYNATGDGKNYDCDGHGTHVAGTIGGLNVGVAKNANLHGIKVLDCNGDGTNTSVIAGINYVIANHQTPAVINMSLGGSKDNNLNTAVQNAVNAGVTVVVAAGNEEDDACQHSPASAPSAITVGGTDRNDRFIAQIWNNWFGSNYGTCVDINAPGYYVYSSVIGSNTTYASYSGTSMASPHVAGVAALYLQDHPTATPAQVTAALLGQAVDTNISYLPFGTPDLFLNTQFTVDPIAVSPAGTIQDTSPTFTWNEFGGSSQYNLVVTQNASTIINQTVSASIACADGQCTYTPSSEMATGSFEWKVRGYMSATGSWSAFNTPTSFTLTGSTPAAISPEGLVGDTNPSFTFSHIGATSYEIQVLDGSTPLYTYTYTPSGCATNCTATPTTALALDTNYTWAVRGYLNSQWSDYSAALDFRVVNLTTTGPTIPSLNGLPTLTWEEEPDATSYAYQVLSGATVVRSGTVTSSACSGAECSAAISSSLGTGDYTWKFKATINGYTSAYSSTRALLIRRPILSAPSGTITDKTPAFVFGALSGASDYRITLMQGATLIHSEEFSASLCSTNCSLTPTVELSSGSYTWFINAKFSGEWSEDSYSQPFTALITTLTNPSGTTLDTRPIYTWEAVPGATYYQYEVYRGATLLFYKKVYPSAVCSGSTCQHDAGVTLLAADHTWRLRAKVSGVWTIYSEPEAFTVAALTLNSPKGTITNDEPVFNWSTVPGATNYELVVSGKDAVEVSAGVCGVSCSYQFPDPFDGGAYTWKARMYLDGAWTAYTNPVSFTILKFTLTNPSGTTLDTRPIYTWEAVPGATYYQYEVYRGATLLFYKKVYPSAVCSGSTCQHDAGVTLLAADHTWRLRAKVSGVWTIYSEPEAFTVAALTLNSPKGTITTDQPVFNWSVVSGATDYQLVVDSLDPVDVAAGDCGASCSYQFIDAFANGAHTWKVRMYLDGAWTAYTSPAAFNILNFNLIAPTGVINTGRPIYTWEEIPGATYYKYEVYKGTTLKFYKKVYPSAVCSGGICSHDSGVGLSANTYTWRLQAKIGGVWTIFSDKEPFTISP